MPVILKIKAFPQSPCDLMDLLAYKISTFQSLKPSYVLVTWFSPDQQTAPCRCECFKGTEFSPHERHSLQCWEKKGLQANGCIFGVMEGRCKLLLCNLKHSHNLCYEWYDILLMLPFFLSRLCIGRTKNIWMPQFNFRWDIHHYYHIGNYHYHIILFYHHYHSYDSKIISFFNTCFQCLS